jgi:diadenylate cyclase
MILAVIPGMIFATFEEFASAHWKDAVEILILTVGIYGCYLGIRGTRGLRVAGGLAVVVLALALVSQLLGLGVISWVLRYFSAVVILSLVVLFQPELRRMLVQLGSHRLFAERQTGRQLVGLLSETAFELSNKHLGALMAVERVTDVQAHIESGVEIDSAFSAELVVTIFHPKTPLHDGGLIIRNDRIASAACIFPVSQRQDLDRNLGLRHRAAIGLTEESDAVVVVVSEETGVVSLCHRGRIEREFTPESLRERLSELLLATDDDGNLHEEPDGKNRIAGAGDSGLGRHQKDATRDDLAA